MMSKNKISFPPDHQAHDTVIEWWYFNGHLTDKHKNHYAFMDTLFRADNKKVNIPFLRRVPSKYICFAHSVVSDLQKRKNEKDVQSIALASKDSFQRPLLYANYLDPVIVSGFFSSTIEQLNDTEFHLKTNNLDLFLKSTKKPMLEGGGGYISVCGRDSYYYSLTSLETKGIIKINEQWITVQGKSWMDHQWADVSYNKDKWSWFSLQLDNGVDIMCVEYSDDKNKNYLVDVLYSNGKQVSLKKFSLTALKKEWQSLNTKAKYPLEWEIEIAELEIKLTVEALIDDQEMVFGEINYWEGPLAVRGKVNGKKVSGQGFMELVGYESDYNALFLAGKELQTKLQEKIKQSKKRFFTNIGW